MIFNQFTFLYYSISIGKWYELKDRAEKPAVDFKTVKPRLLASRPLYFQSASCQLNERL